MKALLGVLLLAAAAGAPARAQTGFDGDANSILARETFWGGFQRYLAQLEDTDPDLAFEWGIASGGRRIGALDEASRAGRRASLQAALERLHDGVKRESLSELDALEFDLYEGWLQDAVRDIDGGRDRARRPQAHLRVRLLERVLNQPKMYMPERARLAVQLLDEQAASLAGSQPVLANPPQVWTEQAILDADGAVDYLDALPKRYPEAFAAAPDKLPQAVGRAKSAILAYQGYLKDDLLLRSRGDFAVGEKAYQDKLLSLQRLDLSAKKLLKLCKKSADAAREELEQAASDMNAAKGWKRQLKEGAKDHPAAAQLVSYFSSEARRLKSSLAAQAVATPPSASPAVLQAPPFVRAEFPLGRYLLPAPFDENSQGAYYVALPDPDAAPEQAEQTLQARFSKARIAVALTGELWPGRALEAAAAKTSGNSVRRVLGSALFTEAWPIYAREAAFEGHLDAPPLSRLELLRLKLLAALEGQLDIELHTQGLSFDKAADLLAAEADLDPEAARAEVLRLTLRPTEAAAAVAGYVQLKELRADAEDELKSKFSPLAFNDRVLKYAGLPPASFGKALIRSWKMEASQ